MAFHDTFKVTCSRWTMCVCEKVLHIHMASSTFASAGRKLVDKNIWEIIRRDVRSLTVIQRKLDDYYCAGIAATSIYQL